MDTTEKEEQAAPVDDAPPEVADLEFEAMMHQAMSDLIPCKGKGDRCPHGQDPIVDGPEELDVHDMGQGIEPVKECEDMIDQDEENDDRAEQSSSASDSSGLDRLLEEVEEEDHPSEAAGAPEAKQDSAKATDCPHHDFYWLTRSTRAATCDACRTPIPAYSFRLVYEPDAHAVKNPILEIPPYPQRLSSGSFGTLENGGGGAANPHRCVPSAKEGEGDG